MANCPYCGGLVKETVHGGKPKRFCSTVCRWDWHTACARLGEEVCRDWEPGRLRAWARKPRAVATVGENEGKAVE